MVSLGLACNTNTRLKQTVIAFLEEVVSNCGIGYR